MTNYILRVKVNEEELRLITANDIDPIEELIVQELAWIDLSGIYVLPDEIKREENEQ